MSDNWMSRRIRDKVIGKGKKFNGCWEEPEEGITVSDPTVHNISIMDLVEISSAKAHDLTGKGVKERTLEAMGACVSMRCHIEGLRPKEAIAKVKAGEWDARFE
jgi:hypothetical protein